ncbi:(2Fe-2S)-binding protein [Sphingosinicella xenopeptidilytica]|uniref:(2Fe-2S)-binding protein n=1 Tax=Sphingosinicella xenopeptidilytica TaxID=364098 RepID=A0ABW3C4P5_SPHXN
MRTVFSYRIAIEEYCHHCPR